MLYGQNMQGHNELPPGVTCLWTLGHEEADPIAAKKTCCERYAGRFAAYRGQKVGEKHVGEAQKDSASRTISVA